MKLLKYFFAFLIICLTAAITVFSLSPKGRYYIEIGAPSIEFINPKAMAGKEDYSLEISAQDSTSGIGHILVTLEGNGKEVVLVDRKYKVFGHNKDSFTVKGIDFKQILGMDQGRVLIKAIVKDKSLWKQESIINHVVTIDNIDPKIDLVSHISPTLRASTPHVVFYKITEDSPYEKGVLIGEDCYFPGYRSLNIIEDTTSFQLAANEEAWISTIFIPRDWKRNDGAWVFAIDDSGNIAYVDLTKKDNILSSDMVKNLIDKSCGLKDKFLLDQIPSSKKRNYISNNFNFSFYLEDKGLEQEQYGSKQLQDKAERSYNHELSFRRRKDFKVTSPNNGVVQYVGASELTNNIGIVIVDHGLGIKSIFKGIDNSSVYPGDFVSKGQYIGEIIKKPGDSYAQFNYQIYSWFTPMSTRYWFKSKSFNNIFLNKVEQAVLALETTVE